MGDTEMAVEAPNAFSGPIETAAHVPVVDPVHHKPAGDGVGVKRPAKITTSSDEDDDDAPLAKKPRASLGGAGLKKKRIVESDSEEDEAPLKTQVKKEPALTAQPNGQTNGHKPASKPRSDPPVDKKSVLPPSSPLSASSDEDSKPLAKKAAKPRASNASTAKTNGTAKAKPKGKPTKNARSYTSDEEESDSESASEASSSSSSSEEEKPLAKKKNAAPAPAKPRKSNASTSSASAKKPPAKKVKVKKEELSESEGEDEVPLAKKNGKKATTATTNGKGKEKAVKEEKPKVKKEKKGKEEEDDEEEKYKWWEAGDNDGSVKWTTLEHRGVLFPPAYVPLPKNVKMKYDGRNLTLPPESEEVAGFFAAMLETDHAQDAKFRENFFKDFKDMLKEYPPAEGTKVSSLEKCDFRPMFEHFEREKEKKKAMTREEKKAIKDAKDALEKPYLFALVDGRKEKVGNFRAEPPGLFRGRGEHPKKGTLKKRLRPSDIILNIAQDAPVPVPNVPGSWGGVQHDNTVTWLAHWKENVNNNSKYVFLSAGSSWKGQSDRMKFEKARELIKHVDKIRKDYTADLKSKVMADRQRATALYFIDKLALRAGNEKGDDEADTVGCCSLRYEHVTLEPPSTVIFDFLGKDSMRFHQEVQVDPQVFKNIKIFKQDKKKGDDLFDRLTTTGLNKYLQDQMKGLTAKVFRTYNASWTFQIQLKNTPKNGSIQEKIAAYNEANREVAILCNHQKTVSKGFEASFAKMGDKVRALKYQRMKLRYQLFTLEPKAKKRYPEFVEDESDVDEEFIERHEEELKERALDGAQKKWEKDNVKLENEKEDKKPKSVLDERLKEIKSEFKELAKERKTKKVEPRRGATEEKLVEQIKKMDERIAAAKVQMGDREKTKDVALGTSKINYIDPRLTVAWAAKYEVPLEKLFSKTLREKFPWAEAEANKTWIF